MTLAWRLAWRDLRGGIGGLRLLAVCLFLGVAAIAGIGSLTSAVTGALSSGGREILGGDVAVMLSQRAATPVELAGMRAEGRVSAGVRLNAMVARADGGDAMLAGLKAVDDLYPLYGRLALAPGALPRAPGQVLLAPDLAERLGVRPGARVRIGEALLVVGGLIADEPDRVGEGFSFGPAAILDLRALRETRLVRPGSLYRWRYRIAIPPGHVARDAAARLVDGYPDSDWSVKDSSDAAPTTRRALERIGRFLTLVALAALIVAGIGVGNGVAAYLEGKRAGIATLKTLGASARLIGRIYLIQIALVAGVTILLALAAGAGVPVLVRALAGASLPVPPRGGLYPGALAQAAAYGLLVALAFVLPPLARARRVGAAALFRGAVEPARRGSPAVLAGSATALLAAAAIAILGTRDHLFAAAVLGAAAVLALGFALLGAGVRWLASRVPRPRRPLVRLALANLHAPAAQTDRLVVALGLGLSLFATLAVIQTSLSGQLRNSVPARAPSFFALDVPADRLGEFRGLVLRAAPAARIVAVPSLRGPIVAVKGVRVAAMKDTPEAAWILHGDRGLTFAADLPTGNGITAGRWWPRDYAGSPLVSLDADAGRVLGLKVGDEITVSALGVDVPARIASFRRIDWDSLGFNFALIFSPHTFDGAPFNYMATIGVAPPREERVRRAVGAAFPSVSLIRVRDIIATVGTLLGQLASAVAAASGVAIAAGIAVLVGAVAAARRARTYDAVLLKLLGATRRQILLSHALEYALLAGVVAAVALAVGAGAGWYVVARLFALPFAPDWGVVLATLGGGAGAILGIGLLGAIPALAARPARALREL